MNTNTLSNNNLPDVQSSTDPRNIAIEYVGVRGVELPVTVKSDSGIQPTVAQISMFVALPAEHKGTHMSRFLGLLKEHNRPLCKTVLIELMNDMLQALESDAGRIDFEFPLFVNKQAPVSKLESLMNYRVRYRVENKKRKVKIGKKEMPWMEAIGQLNNNLIKILRVGHPERMKKDEYVSAISKWIQL